MKYYFVDHDNNPQKCTENYKNVTSDAVVYLYYTDASRFMDMNMFEYFDFNNIKHKVIHVTDSEKEAIDNRIKFDIVELFQKQKNFDFEIFVISTDNGYRSVKNILSDKYNFKDYYCITDFSCNPASEQKAVKVKTAAKKAASNAVKKKADNVTSIFTKDVLIKEISDYLHSNKNAKFSSADLHKYLQKKHKGEDKFSLKKYGLKTMKQLLALVDDIKCKNDKYYVA